MAAGKRKKSTGISFKHAFALIAVLGVMTVLLIGGQQKMHRHVAQINVNISALDEGKSLIKADDIYSIIGNLTGFDIDRASFIDFDITEIEAKLNADRRILSANVFFGKNGNMFIDVEQRQPIVRIDAVSGQDYYLDKEGHMIPVIGSSILRLPIATGSIEPFTPAYRTELNNNLNHIYTIANEVDNDPFLKSLTEQINIAEDGTIVLIPKLGRNKIILGTEVALDEKLNKLKTYYKQGIKRVGLDRFSEINLSYEGQIVGIK